jgi:predicted nucleic acid-binding protein
MTGSPSNGKFVIDSYGWIEYFSEGPLAAKYAKYIDASTPEKCFTPTVIMYEVYKKLLAAYGEEAAMMAAAHIEHCTTVADIDMNLAMKGAEASLSEGLPMADALIRGTAEIHGAAIVTSDPHFRGKSGVIFIE